MSLRGSNRVGPEELTAAGVITDPSGAVETAGRDSHLAAAPFGNAAIVPVPEGAALDDEGQEDCGECPICFEPFDQPDTAAPSPPAGGADSGRVAEPEPRGRALLYGVTEVSAAFNAWSVRQVTARHKKLLRGDPGGRVAGREGGASRRSEYYIRGVLIGRLQKHISAPDSRIWLFPGGWAAPWEVFEDDVLCDSEYAPYSDSEARANLDSALSWIKENACFPAVGMSVDEVVSPNSLSSLNDESCS